MTCDWLINVGWPWLSLLHCNLDMFFYRKSQMRCQKLLGKALLTDAQFTWCLPLKSLISNDFFTLFFFFSSNFTDLLRLRWLLLEVVWQTINHWRPSLQNLDLLPVMDWHFWDKSAGWFTWSFIYWNRIWHVTVQASLNRAVHYNKKTSKLKRTFNTLIIFKFLLA